MKKKNNQKKKNNETKRKTPIFPPEILKYLLAFLPWLVAVILFFSFFDKAGAAGHFLKRALILFVGKGFFFLPFIFIIWGIIIIFSRYRNFGATILLALFFLIFGISGIFETLKPGEREGGYLGFLAGPLLNLFGFWVSQVLLWSLIFIGLLLCWKLLTPSFLKKREIKTEDVKEKKGSIFSQILKAEEPEFKIKELEPPLILTPKGEELKETFSKKKAITAENLKKEKTGYQFPPLELLEGEKGSPTAGGDIRENSAIIKKTLQHFGIQVEMGEVNIGPTVTQYTLKPAEGIKLSKITSLSNDLALALAAHPIRIEAPIPGKSLVGIEVPNRVRSRVGLKNLFSDPAFQNASSPLYFALGRDVAGIPVFADLAKMPHLLVAGSTGTGKTIFLNSFILSLLYRNTPQTLRLILVDPKRVEFPIYNDLPHLLAPVIYDASRTVIALKWLIGEMERRFDILAQEKARDIIGFNEIMRQKGETLMPYLVLIVDELADLMAAKGREMEAGIVRIAQLARAVGIHLVVATQRPSVEVITGLIKANITARVTFQVAAQVDSRTVLDMAGAEKLLGAGDLLFVSAEVGKPKRIQGAFVSEKEVKKVVQWIKSQNSKLEIERIGEGIFENHLSEDLGKTLEGGEGQFSDQEDPLYEEAKRIVIEARKASASLLQRRLRIGYARAARLLDILEERGIVGPSEGAKPREVYLKEEKEEEWQSV